MSQFIRPTLFTKLMILLGVSAVVVAGSLSIANLGQAQAQGSVSVKSQARTKVQVARAPKAVVKLSDAVALETVSATEQSAAHPISLAAADFDEDGIADLMTGNVAADSSNLKFYRGNSKAIFPDRNSKAEEPVFFASTKNFSSDITPDFMLAGDFDADGHADVAIAARNHSLINFYRGDGKGNFAEAEALLLAGNVTAMATGEINRGDNIADIAVSIDTPEGARVLVFNAEEGALSSQPQEYAVSHSVTAFAFGLISNDSFYDLAIAAGSEFVLLEGRQHTALVMRKNLPFAVESLAVGNFSGNSQRQIAMLTKSGAVYVMQDARTGEMNRRQGISTRANWQPELLFDANDATRENAAPKQLLRTRISNSSRDDLLLLNETTNQFQILTNKDNPETTPVSLASKNEIVAALPLRVNASAQQGLVLLNANSSVPSVVTPEAAMTFTVTSTLDLPDSNAGDGVCGAFFATGGPLVCTLRAAIQEANANVGADTILFNIGAGTQTISVNSVLPAITEALTINGIPQGSAPPSQSITLSPSANFSSNLGAVPILSVTSGNTTIRRLTLSNIFSSATTSLTGLALNGNNNFIEGNFIQSWSFGLALSGGNSTIGGTTAAARNVLGGNTSQAIEVAGSGAVNNQIIGNYIGTDATGTQGFPNAGGVNIRFASNNTIGGVIQTLRNIISGNTTNGLRISGISESNIIQGNYIGVDATGSAALGNGAGLSSPGSVAVLLDSGAFNNTVGGPSGIAGNVIANNNGIGVGIFQQITASNIPPLNNRISSNSIYNNTQLGIDLGFLGITANDTGDADTGANNLQNFPILTSATQLPTGGTIITGTLNSTANTQFIIEFFENTACDASGNGEGESPLGSTTVTTDANGNATFSYAAPRFVFVGRFITATATDPNGNTSEFSACERSTTFSDLAVTQTATPNPALSANVVTYTITATNNGPNIARLPLIEITPPPQLSNVTCTAPTGWTCRADGSFFAETSNFVPGSVVITVRGTLPCLAQDANITSVATIYNVGASDQNPANNSSTLNTPARSGTAVGTVSYDAGGTALQLGPVVAGAVSTAPNGTFTLTNTGCLPMSISTASFVRSGDTALLKPPDDSRYLSLRIVNATGADTVVNPIPNPDRTAQVLFSINRIVLPGQNLRFRVLFNPPLPLFAGKISRTNDSISGSQALPDTLNSQVVFNFVSTGLPSFEAIGDSGTATANVVGRVSPAIQIIPRDGFTLPPASFTEDKPEAGEPLVILDRIRDLFRVGISAYDANSNATKITYQFFDTYGQPASSVIEVPVPDLLAAGFLRGQPFTLTQSFTGAAARPDVTSVRVSISDADGTTVSATSNSTNALLSIPRTMQEAGRNAFSDQIQLPTLAIAPLQPTRRTPSPNRSTTRRTAND